MVVLAAGTRLRPRPALEPDTPPPLLPPIGPAPWNVQSGGIAAYDVQLDEKGAVTSTEIVQDVAPYGAMLGEALPSWRFEPARGGGRPVKSRVLVLGLFRPPGTTFVAPGGAALQEHRSPPTRSRGRPRSPFLPIRRTRWAAPRSCWRPTSPRTGGDGPRGSSPRPVAFDGAAGDAARLWKVPARPTRHPRRRRARVPRDVVRRPDPLINGPVG